MKLIKYQVRASKTPVRRHKWSQDWVQVERVIVNMIPLECLSYIPFSIVPGCMHSRSSHCGTWGVHG